MTEFTEQEVEVFEFLDVLRESGVTNMFGAGAYIEREFSMEKKEARQFLSKWMETFAERHPSGERFTDWDQETFGGDR